MGGGGAETFAEVHTYQYNCKTIEVLKHEGENIDDVEKAKNFIIG